ncbi:hypothetical protein B0H67DRAFT_445682, partial [Lasiosphaeris hirsuta]
PESDSDMVNKKGTLSTTTSGFEARAYENGILDPTASRPAQDLDIIRHHLTRRRSSTQPSEHTHQQYCRDISDSFNEATASQDIQSDLMKKYNDLNYGKLNQRAITGTPKQVFNKVLSNPHPDRLDGFKTKALPSHMHSHALHTGRNSLSLCHFAAEFKRIGGNLHQAAYQAAYDGATSVYARDQALA